MDRIRRLCYNLGNCATVEIATHCFAVLAMTRNCILVVYLLEVSAITCYRIDTFNFEAYNPGGAVCTYAWVVELADTQG